MYVKVQVGLVKKKFPLSPLLSEIHNFYLVEKQKLWKTEGYIKAANKQSSCSVTQFKGLRVK